MSAILSMLQCVNSWGGGVRVGLNTKVKRVVNTFLTHCDQVSSKCVAEVAHHLLKTESCHDANFAVTGGASHDKVGIMTTLSFLWLFR